MTGFFRELQRRKVYRVAAAYAVVSWLLIQISATVFPAWELPTWALRMVIALVLGGFPIALVFAWAFEVTPVGIQTTSGSTQTPLRSRGTKNLFLLGGIGLLLSLAGAFFVLPRLTASRLDKSIAVLPFENFSSDPKNAHFADGIQDDILTNLAKIGDLKVISRTSVMSYRGSPKSVREIGKALGVGAVLEGSVRRENNRVRVNVQLIDASNDRHIWAQEYDRELTDVFAIQSDLADKIASSLKARLSSSEQAQMERRPTQNGEAYLLYLQAHPIFTLPDQSREDWMRAAELYEKAIQLDPTFALAFADLSRLESWIYHTIEPVTARREKARAMANEALRLQPELPEAHLALGYVYYYGDRNYESALEELTKAQHGLPNCGEVFLIRAAIERRQGKWKNSTANFEKAASLSPKDAVLLGNLALNFASVRDYGAATKAYDRAIAVAPDSFELTLPRARVDFEWKGDLRPMQKLLAKIPENFDPNGTVTLARYNLKLYERRYGEALEVLQRSPRPNLLGETSAPLSKAFLAGHVYWLMKDEAKRRVAFQDALAVAEEAVRQSPFDGPRHALLGLTYAGLNRKSDAIREGKRAVELLPESQDAADGPILQMSLARIYLMVGEPDEAIKLLEHLVSIPSGLSPHELRIDPTWDSLRNDPRFKKLVAAAK